MEFRIFWQTIYSNTIIKDVVVHIFWLQDILHWRSSAVYDPDVMPTTDVSFLK